MPRTMRNLQFIQDAVFLRERGISCLPLRGKVPALDAWKEYTRRHPTMEEIERWAEMSRVNIAAICGRISGIVAIDADSWEVVERLQHTLPATDMMTQTSKGIHFYCKLKEGQEISPRARINGMLLDLRGEVSYALVAHSIHPETGRPYERVGTWDLEKVPYFDPSWIERAASPMKRIPERLAGDEVDVLTRIARARSYLARLDPAVSGQGGHNRAMYAASCLVQKFGLTIEQAWPLFLEYNDRCSPKWTARELLHKLQSAVQNLQSKGQNQ